MNNDYCLWYRCKISICFTDGQVKQAVINKLKK